MQRMIEHLRERPKEDRQVVAFTSAAGVVAVLLLGWSVASLGLFTRGSEAQTASVADAADKSGFLAPVTDAVQNVSGAYGKGIEELKRIQQGNSTYVREGAYETGAVVPINAAK